MGDEAEARIESIVNLERRHNTVRFQEVLCMHGVVADWCSYCKHGDKGPDRSLKTILRNENLAIVENFEKWPNRAIRTT